jgi:Trimethylamine methyltransferase (MTTB)
MSDLLRPGSTDVRLDQTSILMLHGTRLRNQGPVSCAHRQRDFESAFWRPTAADDKIYEQWILSGSRNAAQQASTKGAWN